MNWQNLPSHSRTWIYQGNRFFTDEENKLIKKMADEFVAGWSSHGVQLSAAIEVFDKLFVVVFVDEAQAAASGCSIDKSMNFIREVEKAFNLLLTDRMQVAYIRNEVVETALLSNLRNLQANGYITDNTLIYDNLIETKSAFEHSRSRKLGESWQKQFV